jgi:predicted nucleotide-binding protein
MASNDLFVQINNAVLDLQSARLQSYDRPLKRLASLLQHPDLAAANEALTKDVDLDRFLEESARTQGGMAGSAHLLWPDNQEQTLGLTLLLIWKFAEKPEFMAHFGHTYYYSNSKILSGVNSVTSQIIIPFVRDYKAYVLSRGKTAPKLVMPMTNKIFIVHGHVGEPREAVARFLERLGFEPIILHEQANQGKTIIEKFEAHAGVGFAVVLLTPDDVGGPAGGEQHPRARQNVILELGYFIGRLTRARVCAMKAGDLELPSDILGIVWTPFDAGWKQALAKELAAAEYDIDWNKVMRA